MSWVWLAGLLRRRPARLVAAAAGVGVAVALLACLGSFLASAQATMTERAVRTVAVDWQVQLAPGADTGEVRHLIDSSPGVLTTAAVGFAHTSGLSATTGSSTQNTGPGIVLGLTPTYRAVFPSQLRTLTGAENGVLLAQQTAANLHAAPGDLITIGRPGVAPAQVTVAGIVELPQANSLFQTVGAPAGAQPAAPPDNVVLLPERQWHDLFDPLSVTRPDLVSTQIHVQRDQHMPPDPAAAYTAVRAAARNLEARSAGAALVGDNLGAALDSARADAAYARIMFLFLGLPGAALAAALTATITSAGAATRRTEQALLRARGATERQLLSLAGVEAAVIGITGATVGLLAAAVVNTVTFGSPRFGPTVTTAMGWPAACAGIGILVATAAVLLPARRGLRDHTVTAGRTQISPHAVPIWARLGLDAALLAGAAVVLLATTGTGYHLVLAPEGVPAISVSYWAFAGPALLWLGAALLTWRLADLLLGRGRSLLARVLRPVTGRLAGIIANGMSRQRRPLVRAIVMLSLAIAFAASTAAFNATYRQQAEVDAQLTNGADVTVTPALGAALAPDTARTLTAVAGVRAVEPIQHRFAYIGADLQDLYGVRPATITQATALQDNYFPHATATAVMATLAAKPDSVLVSAETVTDFQLHLGDPVMLRLIDADTQQPRPVTFHYVGIVTEFPTAPKDSFFVANAEFIAAKTGSDAPGAFLIDTGGRDTAAVSARIRALVGTSAAVNDIATVRSSVGSSLTSVDLSGLTRIELAFALVLAVGAGALALALGLAERKRSYALFTALGAHTSHLRAMVLSETAVLTVVGILAGALTGSVLSVALINILTGVFDPPPATIAIPWAYLTAVLIVAVGALTAASAAFVAVLTHKSAVTVIHDA
ncbi:ABC transporter permease [Mycolicibacterium sphagni]|uniref:ABC transporter permease n=1 Tax=Mycolicibacterium sphagni TaxID=1786 RepID=A0ABX2JX97_9MYCO|nr:ABC transporter permease [Mycolicibacterium sphagni]NTY62348.1 ABC transporter permease [Mycolicibacterium sphagni]